MCKKTSVEKVSDFFIMFARDKGDSISNLKLQKLLYYSQGWYLGIHNERLFDGEFQAWVHGPVEVSQYHRFKKNEWREISDNIEKPEFTKDIESYLQTIYEVYGKYYPYELERMTHSEKPWINARKDCQSDESCTNIISDEDMVLFFSNKTNS